MPDKPCNKKNGGIWVYSGNPESETMDWECLCTYPQIAGNAGCEDLNVCKNETWTYDAVINSDRAPSKDDCKCDNGYNLLAYDDDSFICVNSEICDNKEQCELLYSGSTFIQKF